MAVERIEYEHDVIVEALIAIEDEAVSNGGRTIGIGAVDAHIQMRARDEKASRARKVSGSGRIRRTLREHGDCGRLPFGIV